MEYIIFEIRFVFLFRLDTIFWYRGKAILRKQRCLYRVNFSEQKFVRLGGSDRKLWRHCRSCFFLSTEQSLCRVNYRGRMAWYCTSCFFKRNGTPREKFHTNANFLFRIPFHTIFPPLWSQFRTGAKIPLSCFLQFFNYNKFIINYVI